jgi:signal transduction histidine kinase
MLGFITHIKQVLHRSHSMYHSSLQARFLLRVLLPPFLILLVISVVAFIFISVTVRKSEMDNLQRAAATTAAKLDREFALRQTILRSTGAEIFATKGDYRDKRAKLDDSYKACRAFIRTNVKYTAAPNGACTPFYAQIAVALAGGSGIPQAVDNGYASEAKSLDALEQTTINDRLKAVAEFFPETSQLLVVDNSRGIVSRADNGKAISATANRRIDELADQALKYPVEAQFVKDGDFRKIVFAYPITQGAIIAVYDLDNAAFLYPSWKSAPIDNTKAYVVVADEASGSGYPKLKGEGLYMPVLKSSKVGEQTSFTSSGIEYLATSEKIGQSAWRVIVASPSAIALGSLANAQIIAVAIVGLLLITFLLVGSLFVRRTVDSILGLVGGAVLFSAGQLDHRIDIVAMSDKEFSQLADVMNNMAVKIQEAEAEIDRKNKEFISVATHEIRAPLTAIIGNLSMIVDDGMGSLDDIAKTMTTQAYTSTIRLRDLVNELLDIARLESGRATYTTQQLDISKEISSMVELQRTTALEKGITVEYEAATQPIMAMADKTKLEIVLTNFISNGIKYNRPNGSVTISHEIKGQTVEITVRDTGLGIPEDQQAKMFQKFFRVEHEDRAAVQGTGLGLYVTKQFIEGMGGRLWFESVHGEGTAFHFTLPTEGKQQPTSATKPDTVGL